MTREEKEAIKGKAIHDAMCSIENRVRHVYNQGYSDGLADGNINSGLFADKIREAYNNGLKDAWECARKILFDSSLSRDILTDLGADSFCGVIHKCSASEAIAKIKEYEEQQRQKWEDDFENKQLEQLCNHPEQQKKIEKSCDNCGHRFDVSCEVLDSGECCINEGKWVPKETEKNCENCGYSYGQNKEYCNISGCCDYKKWTQKQICRTCEYDGDNYKKLGIGFYAKQAHCNCCYNFDGYSLICDGDKIRVGDQLEEIIEGSLESRKCVVLKIDDCVTVVYDDGEVGYINPECYRKTGKHFPEILEFIKKMKEK